MCSTIGGRGKPPSPTICGGVTHVSMQRSAPVTYVYDFEEETDGGRELLGGKGIGLAEMTRLGVPVPAGFTITTDAGRAYMAAGGVPAGAGGGGGGAGGGG